MPRPRLHPDNAAKQKAYRERQKQAREARGLLRDVPGADLAAKLVRERRREALRDLDRFKGADPK